MPTKSFILTVLSFPICPVSAQWNTRCFNAMNQMKWITLGLRSECTGTCISRLALFTEPQLLGRSNGRGIRDELVRGSKASLNSNPLWALLWCTVIRLNQPSSSALCCPAAQLLRSSPNSFVVRAMVWNSRQFTIQNFHCTTACWTVHWRSFPVFTTIKCFISRKKKKHPSYTGLITMTHQWFNRVQRWNNVKTAGGVGEGRGKSRRENMRQRSETKTKRDM